MADELSGLQLREAVARKVMGVVPREIRARDTKGYITVWCDHPIFVHNRLTAEQLQGTIQSVPAYESSIEAAWLVVEKMRGSGWSFSLMGVCRASSVMRDDVCCFKRSVRPPQRDDSEAARGYSVKGEMPLAICRAALSAVRASTKEAK